MCRWLTKRSQIVAQHPVPGGDASTLPWSCIRTETGAISIFLLTLTAFVTDLHAQGPVGPPPGNEQTLPRLVDLETSLNWTLQSNPNLIAVRQNLSVSSEAVAVAQRFPTSLNPTVSVDSRPWVYQAIPGGGRERLQSSITVNWSQPIELGGRTSIRTAIASAAYSQTRWSILQAELTALVQTYRSHQTATYRRERLLVAAAFGRFESVVSRYSTAALGCQSGNIVGSGAGRNGEPGNAAATGSGSSRFCDRSGRIAAADRPAAICDAD